MYLRMRPIMLRSRSTTLPGRVLEVPENWSSLAWPIDRGIFIERLAYLRVVRNDVMHFNPDATPA